MAKKNTTAPGESFEPDDTDKSMLAMDRAFGIIDSLYTLGLTGDVNSLCEGTLLSMLDAAMDSIKDARAAIFRSLKSA